MNCTCAICCSHLDASDDIFATQCGHIFHFPCLTQWLERSNTCPQCRHKTSSSRIFRLYFNISVNDSVREDAGCLQERIDNLQFQMLLRDKEITDFKSMAAQAQNQVAGLRKEVLKLESVVEQKNTAIHALKQQAKYFKQTSDEGKKYKEQAETLKLQLADLKDVQTILTATNDDADRLIDTAEDPRKLAVYVSALKRELTNGSNRRKEHKQLIRQLTENLNKADAEKHALNERLKKARYAETVINQIQEENESLKNRLDRIVKQGTSNETAVISTKSDESSKKSTKNVYPLVSPKSEAKEDEENSPYLRYKVQNLMPDMRKRVTGANPSSALSSSSILAKKPRLADNPSARANLRDESYTSDGLGGFTKIEQFPTGTGARKKMTLRKTKTQMSDINNAKIRDFVDLT